MWTLTVAVSLACLVAIAGLHWQSRKTKTQVTSTPAFQSFQYAYFFVFLLANASDWLQGPYVYALYEQYGHDKDSIALLFIAGFFSSMIFGTFTGSLADI